MLGGLPDQTDMKGILLLLSLIGFFLALKWFRKDLHPSFYPAVTVSGISVMTCLGGIIGLLGETVNILFFLGLFSFFLFGTLYFRKVFRNKWQSETTSFLWMLCSFLGLCICSAFLLQNRFLYAYDDFSHWGLVSNILLKQSRLPTISDGLMFPSYPLGSASFICFCCRVIGNSSGACLLAQNVMLISFLLSLQSISSKRWAGILLATAAIPMFQFYNTPIDSLSVDNLLGAAFLSAMLLFLWENENHINILPDLMVILSACVMIKNSGLFLAIGIILLFLIRWISIRQKTSPALICLFVPFLIYLAWRIHLKTCFSDFGKHYMSLYVYYGTFRRKITELGLIFQVILPVITSPIKNHALLMIPAFALVYWNTLPEIRKEQKRIILICCVLFVFYEAGILVMYICSMGTGELIAQNGGDFPRYNGTIICALAGILMKLIARSMNHNAPAQTAKRSISLMAAASILVACMSMKITPLKSLDQCRKENPDASAFSTMTKGRSFTEGQEIAVLFHEEEPSDYEAYMAYYYLYPVKNIKLFGSRSRVPELGNGISLIDLRQSEGADSMR